MHKNHYNLAIIAPVPFYYHIPLYQKLAESQGIDLMVYYCSDETIHGDEVIKTYHSKRQPIEEDLLNGYKYKFLKNYSFQPSFLKWPFGLVNFGIWNEIKKGKYDAIVLQSWTNLTWWLAFLACLKFKIPILFMTDSNVSSEDSKSKIKIYFKRLVLQKFLFKKANGFLTSGTANEKFHRYYGVPKEKMIRLYFSWGYEKFLMKSKQLEQERKKLRESLNIKEKDFVILYVGRLSYEKSLFCLLDAFDKINIPNKKLLLVGDGPLRSEIEQKIKRLKTKEVFIMGFQPRKILPKFYVSADVFVLPSTAETWGIVVNEAMCFNLPVIVSDKVGAGTDLIKNGYNGFIFKAEDSEDLSSKLIYLAKLSEKDRMIFRNRSKEMIIEWVNNLDVEEQMAKVFNLLEKQKNRKS